MVNFRSVRLDGNRVISAHIFYIFFPPYSTERFEEIQTINVGSPP